MSQFRSAYFCLRTGLTTDQRQHGPIHIHSFNPEGHRTVSVHSVNEQRSVQARISRMSVEEKAKLLAQLEGEQV